MALRHTTAAEYEQRVLRAQQLIQEHLDEPLEPAALARAAHFSLHHFHRVFRGQTGETIMQHVRRLRLERAAREIRLGDRRIIDVALDAGYESHEAFTRAFVERFGMPPSEFREQPSARIAMWRADGAQSATIDVRIESYPALRVAFMRHRGSYAQVGETWQKMRTWAASRGLMEREPRLYGVCPDDPEVTEESFLRFDACIVVDDNFSDPGVGVEQIPAGTYAVGVHRGPYDRLHETYLEIIGRWFPSSGYELAVDPVVEHYLNDPGSAAPTELRTEVRVRIAD